MIARSVTTLSLGQLSLSTGVGCWLAFLLGLALSYPVGYLLVSLVLSLAQLAYDSLERSDAIPRLVKSQLSLRLRLLACLFSYTLSSYTLTQSIPSIVLSLVLVCASSLSLVLAQYCILLAYYHNIILVMYYYLSYDLVLSYLILYLFLSNTYLILYLYYISIISILYLFQLILSISLSHGQGRYAPTQHATVLSYRFALYPV